LIPFLKRFAGAKADVHLPAKLRDELPGILAWAVRGCVEWVDNGLGSSAAVDAATAEYRAETDVLEQFFQDRCYFYPEGRVSKKALFQAWENWCDKMGEHADTQTRFTRTLNERGVVKNFREGRLTDTSRGWHGISLNPPPSDESVQSQKSCKHKGGDDSTVHFSENSPNLPGVPSRIGGSRENDEKVYSPSESVQEPSRPPSEDDYLEDSETFQDGDLTVRYRRGE
jgi:phage/plasmid-associated DNA primase